MRVKSLHQFMRLRRALIAVRNTWMRGFDGVALGREISLSLTARLKPARRGSIVVGDRTLIAFKTLVFSRDAATGRDLPVRIGRHCFIGGGSTILPGVSIGDGCIVGAGSVVCESVPPRSVVAGNPARVLRSGIEVGPFGRLVGADETAARLWHDA